MRHRRSRNLDDAAISEIVGIVDGCTGPLSWNSLIEAIDERTRVRYTRQALNNLVSGKSGISPEMAVRLSKAFGSSPEVWLGMQIDFDLAQVRVRERDIKVRRYHAPQAT